MVEPRWEWRTFGEHVDEAESVLARTPVDAVVESDELYLLSAAGTDIVKVRDGRIDVKHLLEVRDDELERWMPVLKVPFPLSAEAMSVVAAAWGGEHRDEAWPAGITLDALLEQVMAPRPSLRAVEVHKRRVRYQLGGCAAELTAVRTERAETRTVAVESVDPQRVLTVLAQLGLASRPNVNYGRGLRILERFGAERFAVIDVGTNSVKLHIGERDTQGGWRRIVDRAVVTRLGEGLGGTGRLGEEPMARTARAIAEMVAEARAARVGAIAAVGTAGLRTATNSTDLLTRVRTQCGVDVEIISGEDEARLAFRAATAGLPTEGTLAVVDTGGGSSQFTFGRDGRIEEQFSVGIGAARITEQFGLDAAVPAETTYAALDAIAADLGRLAGHPTPTTLIAMGGAVTNLAAVRHGLAAYDPEVVQGTVLDRAEIDRQIELFRTRSAAERRSIVGLQPDRAEVILAGACIVRAVLDRLGADSLTVSDRGLRYGVLAERFASNPPGRNDPP